MYLVGLSLQFSFATRFGMIGVHNSTPCETRELNTQGVAFLILEGKDRLCTIHRCERIIDAWYVVTHVAKRECAVFIILRPCKFRMQSGTEFPIESVMLLCHLGKGEMNLQPAGFTS